MLLFIGMRDPNGGWDDKVSDAAANGQDLVKSLALEAWHVVVAANGSLSLILQDRMQDRQKGWEHAKIPKRGSGLDRPFSNKCRTQSLPPPRDTPSQAYACMYSGDLHFGRGQWDASNISSILDTGDHVDSYR